MALDYAKVLKAQNISTVVIGRGETSAANFREKSGWTVETGGLESWLKTSPTKPDCVIVAVGIEQLAQVASDLIDFGVGRILLEKPGGLNSGELKALNYKASLKKAQVYIAYNRRFYASTIQAQKMIQDDGGVSSFNFEFTELSQLVKRANPKKEIMNNWFLANSTHVVDLAFFLGGKPEMLTAYTAGSVDWHPKAAEFAGAGKTGKGVLFSYQANWRAPGRWGVEVLTDKCRYIFRPMEQLHIQESGSFEIKKVDIDDRLDQEFKPGLFLQTEAFMNNDYNRFSSLEEQISTCTAYDQMIP